MVLEGSVAVGEGVNRASIDLSAMPAGVYLVAVEADGGRKLARVVRQ